MSGLIPGNQKHLSMNGRIAIEKALDNRGTSQGAAKILCKGPTTISKEVRLYRIAQPHNTFNGPANKCAPSASCKRKNTCGAYAPVSRERCRPCPRCNSVCYSCPPLERAPSVCNGCEGKSGCGLDKPHYRATTANRRYKTVLVESRNGTNMPGEGLMALDHWSPRRSSRGSPPT